MAGLLSNLRNTMIVSFILALIVVGGYHVHNQSGMDIFLQALFRWMHVLFGIMWIGLLWYFNFVQIRKMPEIPAELKPAVSKFIAPEALFWFRWAALFTVLMGLILAWNRGYLVQALALGFTETPVGIGHAFIGLGMWLGIIMMTMMPPGQAAGPTAERGSLAGPVGPRPCHRASLRLLTCQCCSGRRPGQGQRHGRNFKLTRCSGYRDGSESAGST